MNSRIAIVGSGQVAEALVCSFCNKIDPCNITVIARNRERAISLINKYSVNFNDYDSVITQHFDYIIIAVKDDCINEVSKHVSTFAFDAIVCHTSGSVGVDKISYKSKNIGVFYPLQSFTKDVEVNFSTIPIFIEGNSDECVAKLKELGELISNNVSVATSKSREKLHLCAVFANNFTNYMFTITNELIESEGIQNKALVPLIKATFERIINENTKEIQTGPARRGDLNTIARHLEILESNKEAQDIYKTFSNSILKKYKDEF